MRDISSPLSFLERDDGCLLTHSLTEQYQGRMQTQTDSQKKAKAQTERTTKNQNTIRKFDFFRPSWLVGWLGEEAGRRKKID